MTSHQVSEAEVEAAVRAECQFDKWDYDAMPKPSRERYFARTRAALTAAAQVRGRVHRAHKTMTAEEYLALNLKGWHEVCWCYDGAGGVGVRYYTNGELPTDSDSGPDVLGEQKEK